jgi:hypothetical protein
MQLNNPTRLPIFSFVQKLWLPQKLRRINKEKDFENSPPKVGVNLPKG